jgi:hypothetical protein
LFFIPLMVYLILVCLPIFFLSWLFLSIILKTKCSKLSKLLLWYSAATSAVLVNFIIVRLISGGSIQFRQDISAMISFFAALFISIAIRHRQFFSLTNKTTQHETNMV